MQKASRHTLIGERSDGRKIIKKLSKIISLYTMIDFQTAANIQKASELFAVRLLLSEKNFFRICPFSAVIGLLQR